MTNIETAKTKDEFLQARADEKADKEWAEIERMSKSVKKNVRDMAAIMAYHKFGYGECPCNSCAN